MARARAMTTGERAATILTARAEGRIQARRKGLMAWATGIACVIALAALASLRREPDMVGTSSHEAAQAPVMVAGLVAASTVAPAAENIAVDGSPGSSSTRSPPASLPAAAAILVHAKPAASGRPVRLRSSAGRSSGTASDATARDESDPRRSRRDERRIRTARRARGAVGRQPGRRPGLVRSRA
jgi:hypothetical protein